MIRYLLLFLSFNLLLSASLEARIVSFSEQNQVSQGQDHSQEDADDVPCSSSHEGSTCGINHCHHSHGTLIGNFKFLHASLNKSNISPSDGGMHSSGFVFELLRPPIA